MRTIARVAGEAVSLFCVVDDHVHVVLFCMAERGRYVQALSLAFRSRVAVQRLQLALEEVVAALPPVVREPEPPAYEQEWGAP